MLSIVIVRVKYSPVHKKPIVHTKYRYTRQCYGMRWENQSLAKKSLIGSMSNTLSTLNLIRYRFGLSAELVGLLGGCLIV